MLLLRVCEHSLPGEKEKRLKNAAEKEKIAMLLDKKQ